MTDHAELRTRLERLRDRWAYLPDTDRKLLTEAINALTPDPLAERENDALLERDAAIHGVQFTDAAGKRIDPAQVSATPPDEGLREARKDLEAIIEHAAPLPLCRALARHALDALASPSDQPRSQGERVTLWRYKRIPNDPWKNWAAQPYGGLEYDIERVEALLLPQPDKEGES